LDTTERQLGVTEIQLMAGGQQSLPFRVWYVTFDRLLPHNGAKPLVLAFLMPLGVQLTAHNWP